MKEKMTFRGRQSEMPEGYFELVNITTDGGINISVNFNEPAMMLAEQRHLDIIVYALKDAFYRLRPDLRRQ
jgi:hypothetical protein